ARARFPGETARLALNLTAIGIDPADLPQPPPPPVPADRLPPGPGRTVAIHPTAKYQAKLWPEERFVEVAEGLARRYPDARFLVVGDAGAGPFGRKLERILPGRISDLSGRLSLSELAGVLTRADLLISLDSGPVHVAAAFGTPVVGVYSSRDYPRSWHPRGEGHEIIRTDPPCAACRKTVCASLECTRAIDPGAVIAAAARILDSRCP
nr:glycosyltransferase family 9 protein [bacterium]